MADKHFLTDLQMLRPRARRQSERGAVTERYQIAQLGGTSNFSPDGLTTRSHAEYDVGTDLIEER